MTIQPTLELHPELTIEDADVRTNCCFCFNRKKVKEYKVDDTGRVVPCFHKLAYRERIEANQRLSAILMSKFENDPIRNDIAFERLKMKINDDMHNGDPLTSEKIARIIAAIEELRQEIRKEQG